MKRFLIPLLAALALPTAVNAESIEFYSKRGLARDVNGDVRGAIKDYSKAIKIYNKNPEIQLKNFRAIAYVFYLRGSVRWNDMQAKYRATDKLNEMEYYRACADFKFSSQMKFRKATSHYKKWCKDLER